MSLFLLKFSEILRKSSILLKFLEILRNSSILMNLTYSAVFDCTRLCLTVPGHGQYPYTNPNPDTVSTRTQTRTRTRWYPVVSQCGTQWCYSGVCSGTRSSTTVSPNTNEVCTTTHYPRVHYPVYTAPVYHCLVHAVTYSTRVQFTRLLLVPRRRQQTRSFLNPKIMKNHEKTLKN